MANSAALCPRSAGHCQDALRDILFKMFPAHKTRSWQPAKKKACGVFVSLKLWPSRTSARQVRASIPLPSPVHRDQVHDERRHSLWRSWRADIWVGWGHSRKVGDGCAVPDSGPPRTSFLFYFSPVGVMQRSQCKLTSRRMFEIIVKENNEGLNRDSRSVVPMSVRSVWWVPRKDNSDFIYLPPLLKWGTFNNRDNTELTFISAYPPRCKSVCKSYRTGEHWNV